jgi:DNA-binding NarL/FixJ family response regulator
VFDPIARSIRSDSFPDRGCARAGLGRADCLAVILDVDSVMLSNRIIRMLKENFPALSIFCTSRRRFHPELQDALSHYISACLSKPVDPDELNFWLKSIRDDESTPGPRPEAVTAASEGGSK